MMKRVFGLATLLALIALAVVPAMAQECDDEIGCIVLEDDDPIVVGYMLTTSGATAFLGEDSLGGIELAIEGRDGELLGREIELIGEDSLCTAEGGQTAAQRLAADETLTGVVGTNCSGAATGALPIISEAGLVMISPSNTSPALSSTEEGGVYEAGYYRTAHNDLFQGSLAARFAVDVLETETLATIHDGDAYTEGLATVMGETFAELQGEDAVVFEGAISKGDVDMTAILTQVAAASPDILYFPIFEPESNFIAAQARTIPGLENTIMMTADGSLVSSFPDNTGEAALGMFMSGPAVSGDAYDEFLELWDEEIGGTPPSGFHAHAYDATNMLLNAIEEVAVEGEDDTLIIGRQALRDALSNVEDYEGLTGVLTCQDESPFAGDCATGEALAIFELTEGVVDGDTWLPPIVWTPADAESEE